MMKNLNIDFGTKNIVGIIGAMDEEIQILKDKMELKKTYMAANMEFYYGRLAEKNIVLVRCGIGKVNAAACTQVLITKFNAEYIINIGVAGAIFDGLEIGDIVISKDVVEHDFDVTSFGYKLGEIPRLETYKFKGNRMLIDIAKKISEEEVLDHNIFVGRILSGDEFVASANKKDMLWKEFEGYCVEMEGAAIGHTCHINNVPFVILRAMSDKADGSADVNFNDFVDMAARNSADIVEKMLKEI